MSNRHIVSLALALLFLPLAATSCLPEASGDGSTQCQQDSDCATGQVCLRPPDDRNRCVQDCTNDASVCSNTQFCNSRYEPNPMEEDRGELVCFPDTILCSERSDCPMRTLCDDATGYCTRTESTDECTFDTDCPVGDACLQPPSDSNRCVPDCSTDESLCALAGNCVVRYGSGNTEICLPSNVLCATSSDCPGDVRCGESGFCDLDAPPVECESDADCVIGDICLDAQCIEG